VGGVRIWQEEIWKLGPFLIFLVAILTLAPLIPALIPDEPHKTSSKANPVVVFLLFQTPLAYFE
jgi:hypothetical protein